MDVGRFAGILGSEENATHQRIAEYVKGLVAPEGVGLRPREEWIAEQTLQALRLMLADTTCTDEERRAIEEFLGLAAEELPGLP